MVEQQRIQASQRIADNPAFTYAVLQANALEKPLVITSEKIR